MNKFHEEIIDENTEEDLEPLVKNFLKDLRHPSCYSKEMLSKIAIQAMVIISKEGQKNIISTVRSSEKS